MKNPVIHIIALAGEDFFSGIKGGSNDLNDIEEKIKIILKTKYSPRKYFVKHHGIDISGKKFRDFILAIASSLFEAFSEPTLIPENSANEENEPSLEDKESSEDVGISRAFEV